MKNIFIRGFLSVFLLGVIFFFGKVVIYDFLVNVFRPVIKSIFGIDTEYLVVLITVAFMLLVIIIVGLIPFGALFKRKGIEKSHGAFVVVSPGTYFLAAIVTKTKFRRIDKSVQTLYVLFSPYAPFPWSGLPIIFAREENVIALNISYRELYSITVSLGRHTPEILEEEIPLILDEVKGNHTE